MVIRWKFSLLVATLLLPAGCGGPARLKPPQVDPDSAAARAMSMYDSNGDGDLSGRELDACPGIQRSISSYDTDGNGGVSAAEIVARLKYLAQFKTALTPLRDQVLLDGRPLAGAEVKLLPEAYLGDEVKSASGTTNRAGTASLTISAEDLPEQQRGYHGIHFGTYKVQITHPEKKLPDKYNTNTTLGYETVVGDPIVVYELRS